eukprot:3934954-Rhodomonas_salina.1
MYVVIRVCLPESPAKRTCQCTSTGPAAGNRAGTSTTTTTTTTTTTRKCLRNWPLASSNRMPGALDVGGTRRERGGSGERCVRVGGSGADGGVHHAARRCPLSSLSSATQLPAAARPRQSHSPMPLPTLFSHSAASPP